MKNKHDMENYIIHGYWFKKISRYVPSLPGPASPKPGTGEITGNSYDSVSLAVDPPTAECIEMTAQNNKKTEFIIYLAFTAVLFYKYFNTTELLVTSPGIQTDKIPPETRNNLLFYQLEVTADTLPKNLLQSTRDEVQKSFNHAQYNYENLIVTLKRKRINFQPLYQLGFYHQGVHTTSKEFAKVNLQFILEEKKTRPPELKIKFNRTQFEKRFIRQLASHYINLLRSFPGNLEHKVRTIDILSPADKEQILESFNNTAASFPFQKTLVDLFTRQVQESPGYTALQDKDRQLTYNELDDMSNRLAHYLREKYHIKPGDLVGLLMGRSLAAMIGILGILKSGAAYVPLDPDYPRQHLTTILKDASIKPVVTDHDAFIDSPPGRECQLIRLTEGRVDGEIPAAANRKQIPAKINSPHDTAYIIYTSGSTGNPKGVMVGHRNVVRLLFNEKFPFTFNSQDTWTVFHSICFDFSVWEIFGALLYGGKLMVVPLSIARTPAAFLNLLEKEQVTVLNQVPTMFYHLAAEFLESKNRRQLNLRYIILGGEALAPSLLKKWQKKSPEVKLVNMYGITETTVHVTYKEIGKKEIEAGLSNIGKPIPTLRCYIVDEYLMPVPIEVPGEILVGGEGVSRGYLNRVELTEEKFKRAANPDKLSPNDQWPMTNDSSPKLSPNDRLYRSGDRGKWLRNGDIEYLGRIDQQVKIRGFRIECGEIENHLLEIEKVKDVKVVAREDKDNNKYLAAYLLADRTINPSQCREYLEKHVPGYMVPAYFIQLEKFPLTSSGKVDKKALPAPMEPDIKKTPRGTAEPPSSETEKVLAVIWQEVLGIETIGVHDNFFNLGGNSIKGIQVVNKIQEWLEEILHVTIIFEAPTIRELAEKLQEYKYTPTGSTLDETKINRMRQFIPSISPVPARERSTLKNPPAVFILSPPRSGTTLLRVILAGHPRLFAPPELELLSFNRLQERKSILSGRFSYFTEGVIRAIMEIKACTAREALLIMEESEKKNLTVQQFYRVLQEWLGDRRLVDKTPFYTLDMETLKRAESYFASPLYIHLLRNPYAVIHSFEEAKLDQIIRFDHNLSVRELAELVWVISNQNIVEFLEGIPADRKFAVKFEELVRDPQRVVRETCEFLSIDYKEEMIRVYENTANKMTDGIHAESKMLGDIKFFTHSSINTSPVDKWKNKYKTEFLGDEAVRLAKFFGYIKETTKYAKIESAPQKDYYELSPAQKRLWILHRLEENPVAYNMPDAFLVQGDLNFDILEKTYETVLRRHDSLRTAFVRLDGGPMQRIRDFESIKFKLKYIDLRNQENREKQAEKLALEEAAEVFDLEKAPLLRIKLIHIEERQYVFLFTMHHIISDGWSMRLLVNEILTLYDAYKNNKKNQLSLLRLQYKDYSEWQHNEKMKKTLKRQEEYWLKEFAADIPVLNLPTDYPRPTIQDFAGSVLLFDLSLEQTKVLNKMIPSQRVSLFMILLAVYKIFLSKISGQEDILVGTPIAGRNHPDLGKIVGMFVNTLVLRSCPAGEKTFITFLRETKEKTLKAFENQDYPFEELVEKIKPERDMSRNPLFDVMFVLPGFLDPASLGENPWKKITDLQIKPYAYEPKISKFDLSLFAVEIDERLYFTFEYCVKLFRQDTMVRFAQYFKKIISSITENPGEKIAEIEIISEEEKKQVLVDFSNINGETGFPRDKTIHQLFKEQVVRTPDHIAVIGQSLEVIHELPLQITYNQLNQKSNQLAHVLREKNLGPDDIVGIRGERSIEIIAGILGILKAGGAYLPIDKDYPQELKQYMLDDSGAQILLTLSNQTARFFSTSSHLHPVHRYAAPTDPAYIIYTSGSSGKPKGVLVAHHSVVNLIFSQKEYFNVNENDRILQFSSICFDASVEQIFIALFSGAVLLLVDKDTLMDIHRFEEFTTKQLITHFHAVPSFLSNIEMNHSSYLKRVISGGDVCPPSLARRWVRHHSCDFYNEYGPTETTVTSIEMLVNQVVESPGGFGLPIGRPINNTTVYLFDKWMKPVPLKVSGELYIGGQGLARGYLNRPELTAEKFINYKLPITKKNKKKRTGNNARSKRIYKTGDLARWWDHGNIEFLGRMDHQVKIRGFRIELGEIENRILEHKDTKEAVVMVKDLQGVKYLYAYIVPGLLDAGIKKEFDVLELKEYLSKKLPGFMVPSYFFQLEKMPLTANGKVDRKVLVELGNEKLLPGSAGTYVAPQAGKEKIIAQTWKEVLKLDKVGIHDNFFDLGGNSLTIIQLHDKLRKIFNKDIPVASLFRHLTISSFATYLTLEESLEKEVTTGSPRTEEIRKSKDRVKKRIERRKGV